MKNCPVCNTQLEDHYTGLCPNSLCSWEFVLANEITPEHQKIYAKKLAECRRLYELNIVSEKKIFTFKDKINKEFNPKIYRANIAALIFQSLVLIVSGILIYTQFKSTLPTLKPAPTFSFIGYIALFFFLFNCYSFFGDKQYYSTELLGFFIKETISIIVGYVGVNIIFSLSESRWIVLLLIPLFGIVAIVYILLMEFESYLEELLNK